MDSKDRQLILAFAQIGVCLINLLKQVPRAEHKNLKSNVSELLHKLISADNLRIKENEAENVWPANGRNVGKSKTNGVTTEKFKTLLKNVCCSDLSESAHVPYFYYCQFCDEFVKNTLPWTNHCATENHKAALPSNNTEFKCYKCGVFMLLNSDTKMDYINSIDHVLTDIIISSKLKQLSLVQKDTLLPTSDNLRCSFSYQLLETLENDDEVSIVCRTVRLPEVFQVGSLLEPCNLEFILNWINRQFSSNLQTTITYYCNYCGTKAINKFQNFIDHLTGKPHRKKSCNLEEAVLILCHNCTEVLFSFSRDDVQNHILLNRHTKRIMKPQCAVTSATELANQNSSLLDFKQSDIELESNSRGNTNVSCEPTSTEYSGSVSETNGPANIVGNVENSASSNSLKSDVLSKNRFLLVLKYIKSRYSQEGYIRGSTTAYYCAFCDFVTSVHSNFKQHVLRKKHCNKVTTIYSFLLKCDKCGLFLLAPKEHEGAYKNCLQHIELDAFMQLMPPTDRNLHTPQSDKEVRQLFVSNSSFLKKIMHTSCCKDIYHIRNVHIENRNNVQTENTSVVRTDLAEKKERPTYVLIPHERKYNKLIKYLFVEKVIVEYLMNSLSSDWYKLTRCNSAILSVYCFVCNIERPSLKSGSSHVRSRSHYVKCGLVKDMGLLCPFCCIYFVSVDFQSFMDHMDNARHKAIINTLLELDSYGKIHFPISLILEETVLRARTIIQNFSCDSDSDRVERFTFIPGTIPQEVANPKLQKDYITIINLRDVLTKSQLKYYNDKKINKFFCLMCDSVLSEDICALNEHIVSRLHIVKSRVERSKTERDSQCWACEICSALFIGINADKFIDNHMSTLNHFYRAARLLRTLNGEDGDDENDIIESVIRTKTNVVDFNDISFKNNNYTNVNYECPPLMNLTLKRIENYCIAFGHNWQPSKAAFQCNFCDGECITGFGTWESHMLTKKHRQAVFSPNVKAVACYCKPCRICIIANGEEGLKVHFKSKKHENSQRTMGNVKKGGPREEDDDLSENDDEEDDNEDFKGTPYNVAVGLSEKCKAMFDSEASIEKTVSANMREITYATKAFETIRKRLEEDLIFILKPKFPNLMVHFFGSRCTGLARRDSDIDVFIDIGNSFYGLFPKNKGRIKNIYPSFEQCKYLFGVNKVITDARVPIMKLVHHCTGIKCDVNTFDGSGVENSRLVKTYLLLDDRVFWLVVAISEWAALNNIKGWRGFTSYSVIWLVLFFLMQPPICLVPPVKLLMDLYIGPRALIGGWDYSYVSDVSIIKAHYNPAIKCGKSCMELLEMFFQYYATLQSKHIILSPLTGNILQRNSFEHKMVPPAYRSYFENKGSSDTVKMTNPIILLDPFVLKFNMLRRINASLLEHFKLLCQETLDLNWCQSEHVATLSGTS